MHTSSTRADGNMSARWGDPDEAEGNRGRFVRACGLDPQDLVMCSIPIPNGVAIRTVGAGDRGASIEADALVTREQSIVLGLLTADCVPLIIEGERHITIAHCGWESTHARLPEKLVSYLVAQGEDASTLFAFTGPAIARESYVQPEGAVSQRHDPRWQPFITPASGGLQIDVPRYVAQQLEICGLTPANITLSEIDTYTDVRYFSHRRARANGETQGRLVTIASRSRVARG